MSPVGTKLTNVSGRMMSVDDPKRSSVSELVQRHDTFSWHRRYWPVFDPQWPSLIFTVA
jgi:hypothetical protein